MRYPVVPAAAEDKIRKHSRFCGEREELWWSSAGTVDTEKRQGLEHSIFQVTMSSSQWTEKSGVVSLPPQGGSIQLGSYTPSTLIEEESNCTTEFLQHCLEISWHLLSTQRCFITQAWRYCLIDPPSVLLFFPSP